MLNSRITTLGEILASAGGDIKTGPFGTKLKANEYTPTGVPVISVGEIGYGHLRLHDKTPRVDITVTNRMPEYLLQYGDIVFGRKGAVDRSARVQVHQNGWFLGSDGIRVRLPSSCDSAFIAYQLLIPAHRDWMIQHAAGTTMPSLNEGIIRRIPIVLLPLVEQRGIAAVLGSLDDKIEQNRRTGAKLEQLARAVFKAWFVDFEPVKAKAAGATAFPGMPPETFATLPTRFVDSELGPVPEGWEVKSLSGIIKLVSGGTPKRSVPKYWGDEIPWYSVKDAPASCMPWVYFTDEQITKKGLDESSANLVPIGCTIISARGTVGKLAMAGREMTFNQSCYGLLPIDGQSFCYLNLLMREAVLTLKQRTHGSVFDTITRQTFDSIQIVTSPADIVSKFDDLVSPIFDQQLAQLKESAKLAALRDYLLPKLLSGRVRVNNELSSPEFREVP